MNLEQLQMDWQGHSSKLNDCIQLNQKLLNEIEANKQSNELDKLVTSRIIEAVMFALIVFLLWQYIAGAWAMTAPIVSAMVLAVFAIIGLAGNIGQIALLKAIDYSNPVKKTLSQLIEVRSHNLNVFKLLVLSVPFYMAYVFLGYELVFSIDLFAVMQTSTKMIFAGAALALAVMTGIFIRKLKPENRNHKLINWFYKEVTGERLTKLLENAQNIKE